MAASTPAGITSAAIDEILSQLPEITARVGHSEIYGIQLGAQSDSNDNNAPARLIVAKFLRAHKGDTVAALQGIEDTLAWRKEFRPREAAFNETHDAKFDAIGYNTILGGDVVAWNIYGAVGNKSAELFNPMDKFLRWRVGLMERCVALLDIEDYTGDDTGEDAKQAVQVHDYMNVSFFRMDPNQKASTKQTVELMSKHYPETMKAKYMVNVPLVMSWMMGFLKLVLSRETLQKITVMSYGTGLVGYLGHAEILPREYGGKGDKALKDIAEPWKSVPQVSSTAQEPTSAQADQPALEAAQTKIEVPLAESEDATDAPVVSLPPANKD